MSRRWAAVGLLGALALVIGLVIGWPRHTATASGTPVQLRNFHIDAPDTVRAGTTRFVATGEGPSMHEFNIAATSLAPADLPTSPDGTIDDQSEHPDFQHVGEAEGIDIGDQKTLTVDLTPAITSCTATWKPLPGRHGQRVRGDAVTRRLRQLPRHLTIRTKLTAITAVLIGVIGGIILLSARSTSADFNRTVVNNIAGRQPMLVHRYFDEVLLSNNGFAADPHETMDGLIHDADALLDGGAVLAVQGNDSTII